MTCKDCIHYTAHKHFYFGEYEDEYFNDDNKVMRGEKLDEDQNN